jgi:SAM-dependent methyltransferase
MWHDVECGSYEADLPLWRELAREAGGAVLDVGAGSGRVALRLAQAGHAVTALDRDPLLLSVLGARAQQLGVRVDTLLADAAGFEAPAGAFALVAVPMQTIQLLDGPEARAGFFASARHALVPGGIVALAITEALEGFDDALPLPLPDLGELDGWTFVSQPVAVRAEPGAARIERVRQLIAPDGTRTAEEDVVRLAHVSPAGLAEEAARHGLAAAALRHVPETDDHVGSQVVVLRG